MWIKGDNAYFNLNAARTVRYMNGSTVASADNNYYYICKGYYVDKLLEVNKKFSATDTITKEELTKLSHED